MYLDNQPDLFPKRFRETRGRMTHMALADELGISRAMVKRYEAGQQMPKIFVLKRMAQRFNISADWLLGIIDDPRVTAERR